MQYVPLARRRPVCGLAAGAAREGLLGPRPALPGASAPEPAALAAPLESRSQRRLGSAETRAWEAPGPQPVLRRGGPGLRFESRKIGKGVPDPGPVCAAPTRQRSRHREGSLSGAPRSGTGTKVLAGTETREQTPIPFPADPRGNGRGLGARKADAPPPFSSGRDRGASPPASAHGRGGPGRAGADRAGAWAFPGGLPTRVAVTPSHRAGRADSGKGRVLPSQPCAPSPARQPERAGRAVGRRKRRGSRPGSVQSRSNAALRGSIAALISVIGFNRVIIRILTL